MSGVIRTLSRMFGIGRARFFVGHDLAKNEYYEMPSPVDPRLTRRFVRYKEKRQPLDYIPMEIPIQWDAWLRHTRRQAPTIRELLDDLERIRMVQHNAKVLELRDQEMRRTEEQMRLQEHADAVDERERLANQQRLEQSSQPQAAEPAAGAVAKQPEPAEQARPAPEAAQRAGPKPQKSTRKMIQLDLDPLPDSPPPARHHD